MATQLKWFSFWKVQNSGNITDLEVIGIWVAHGKNQWEFAVGSVCYINFPISHSLPVSHSMI